jgi:hypothetical protein
MIAPKGCEKVQIHAINDRRGNTATITISSFEKILLLQLICDQAIGNVYYVVKYRQDKQIHSQIQLAREYDQIKIKNLNPKRRSYV